MPAAKYWFPAKRNGWGWGLPITWQGWTVLIIYIALVIGGIPVLQVSKGDLAYLAYAAFLTSLLIGICWAKGEPPHRRRRT